jgi:F0F1-type ATP synthase assembly protein I
LGLLLDYLLGTLPGFTIGLTILGVIAAFYQLIQMAKKIAKKTQTPNEPPHRKA